MYINEPENSRYLDRELYCNSMEKYCTKESFFGPWIRGSKEVFIYLGLTDFKNPGEEMMKYEIESIHIPPERLCVQTSGYGSNDIALFKTKRHINFVTGKIMPVSFLCQKQLL